MISLAVLIVEFPRRRGAFFTIALKYYHIGEDWIILSSKY
jgi:hypothetical protein